MSRSLTDFITKNTGLEFDSEKFHSVFQSIVRYVCLDTSIKEFHADLQKHIDFPALELTAAGLRMMIRENGYIVANLRFYSSFLASTYGLNGYKAEEFYHKFEMDKIDAVLIYRMLKTNFRKEVNRYIKSRGLSTHDFGPDSLYQISDTLAKLHVELIPHIKRVTTKKLSFIKRFHNMTFDELWTDLTIVMIQSYYRSVPNKFDYAKQLNYLRASVSNRALNLLNSYVTQKRQRLVNVGTDNKENAKFILKTQVESQLPLDSEGNAMTLDSVMSFDRAFNPNIEFEVSLAKLSEKYGKTKRGFILKLFTGGEIASFNKYLFDKRILRSDLMSSQDFLLTRPSDEVRDVVADFLDISRKAVDRVLEGVIHDLNI